MQLITDTTECPRQTVRYNRDVGQLDIGRQVVAVLNYNVYFSIFIFVCTANVAYKQCVQNSMRPIVLIQKSSSSFFLVLEFSAFLEFSFVKYLQRTLTHMSHLITT